MVAESEQSYAVSLESVQQAAERIKPFAHTTQVMTCSAIDKKAGFSIFFKCEQFQKGGAFKFRGACNAIQSLTEEQKRRGVVTHSSGNHALSIALAARLAGIPAYIVVPSNTPQVKQDAIAEYSGLVELCEPNMDAREAGAARVQERTGACFIPPYNHPDVMAGQGTMALELLDQVGQLDAVIVPISGGGMCSGVATVAKALQPGIRVIAAEPLGRNGAADVAASKAEGRLRLDLPKPDTIADGLQGRMGDLTWPVVRDLVDAVVTARPNPRCGCSAAQVSEEEIVAAMRLCYERMKALVEPSGAVGLAAALSLRLAAALGPGAALQRVGVILSGGNADLGARGFWQSWLP